MTFPARQARHWSESALEAAKEITPDLVRLKKGEEIIELPNQAIIVCAGGELPTPMLKKIGIQVEARYGT